MPPRKAAKIKPAAKVARPLNELLPHLNMEAPKIIHDIAKVQKVYLAREEEIPKWVAKEGLKDLIIPQQQIIDEFNDWPFIEMGMVMALRVVFPRVGIKERVAIYPNRIERQAIYPAPSLRQLLGGDGQIDHNHMLRTDTKVRYSGRTDINERMLFNNEATFRQALKIILLANHTGSL